MMRYAFLVALIGCLCNSTGAAEELYKTICRNSEKVKLTKMEQVQQLSEEISRHPEESDCPSVARGSITALLELIKTDEFYICSQRKAELFKLFYDKFIISKKGARAPVAIRSFYAAYGLKVSLICRRRMVQLLNEPQIDELLEAEDRQTLAEWSSDQSPLVYILKGPEDFDDLEVPKPLTLQMGRPVEERYLDMQAETVSQIRRQQAICERRLKRIYEPLLEPVVSLSNLGFNYRGSDASASQPANVHEYVYQWYRALFMCRSLSAFVLVDDEKVAPTENGKEQRVKLLPVVKTNKYDGVKTYEEMIKSFEDIKPIEFKLNTAKVQVVDPIVGPEDSSLARAMEKFKKKASRVRKGGSLSRKMVQRIESGLSKFSSEKMSSKVGNKILSVIDRQLYKRGNQNVKELALTDDDKKFYRYIFVPIFIVMIIGLMVWGFVLFG